MDLRQPLIQTCSSFPLYYSGVSLLFSYGIPCRVMKYEDIKSFVPTGEERVHFLYAENLVEEIPTDGLYIMLCRRNFADAMPKFCSSSSAK